MKQDHKEKFEFIKKLIYDLKPIIIDKINSGYDISIKERTKEFVTNVDTEIQNILVDSINEKFKNQSFIAEEEDFSNSCKDDLWIIDPIDGTMNFIYQGKDFSVSLAFYSQKEPVFGIVYDVIADEMFVGIKGRGAFLNGEKLSNLKSDIAMNEIIFGGRFVVFDFLDLDIKEFHDQIAGHRNISSSALEICHLASGRLHIYISQGLRLWDIAAANIILNEVGGLWSFGDDFNHLTLVDRKERYFAAANAELFSFINNKNKDK